MQIKRSAGILMPVFSLPSAYGIGSFGAEAHGFIDFLALAGQRYWQMLPLGPTGYGNSPYQSYSSFAGNFLFIDLPVLAADGLITAEELRQELRPVSTKIDYDDLLKTRPLLLEKATGRAQQMPNIVSKFNAFSEANASWLSVYSLYMALKDHFGGAPWYEWPENIRRLEPAARHYYEGLLRERILYYAYIQYFFYSQWQALREYAHSKDVSIIGDLPIYVSLDSADTWSEPHFFQLGPDLKPTDVSGVPPDCFNEEGQLWGNPLYDWNAMERDGFGWWIRRIDGVGKLFDVIRIDHFRGIESYWSVPASSTTAKNGRWVKGPGIRLVSTLTSWFNNLSFIAEDLGSPSEDVDAMLKASGLPGMRVLQFAFDGFDPEHPSTYLPFRYNENCICYTGTHDNDTFAGKMASDPETAEAACRYLGCAPAALTRSALRLGLSSAARLFVAPLADYLNLGSEARINVPGTATGNWAYEFEALPSPDLAAEIRELTWIYSRL